MEKVKNYTQGSVFKCLISFSLPYLLSGFLQTFYGMADLFIAGQFNGSATITAISVGSQVMHMLTVIILGLSMGTTVIISRAVGSGEKNTVKKAIGNTVVTFSVFIIVATTLLILLNEYILKVLSVPQESLNEAKSYIIVCFAGVVFITAYNVISSIFRGLGDSKTPMYFVAVSGLINIFLDYLFIGVLGKGAFGAALATVISQAVSVIVSLLYVIIKVDEIHISKSDLKIDKYITGNIVKIGLPVAAQDGFIQIAFLVITVIANRRGVDVAAAVGIVEKIIGFMFLVPSAMLSSVSTISAQNAGAGFHDRGRKTLLYGISACVAVGIIFTVICQFKSQEIVMLFAKNEPNVIVMGSQYLKAYVFDCIVAGIHFCFSGYFCAYKKSYLSFAHNLASILLVRIPGAYLASIYFSSTLYPMGLAAPLGSLLSAIICVVAYAVLVKKKKL